MSIYGFKQTNMCVCLLRLVKNDYSSLYGPIVLDRAFEFVHKETIRCRRPPPENSTRIPSYYSCIDSKFCRISAPPPVFTHYFAISVTSLGREEVAL